MTGSLEEAATSIIDWAMSDSDITLDREDLLGALLADRKACGRYPTERECELLVTGGDDGEVPEELIVQFPASDALLASYF